MAAPVNDTQAGAIILDGESGGIAGTTLETVAGEELDPNYISNGRDVWYKLRVAWLRSFAELREGSAIPYVFYTLDVDFWHIIRVYCKIGSKTRVYQSRGGFTPGFGKRQLVEFNQNFNEFPITRLDQEYFIYVQVDAADARLETGDFTLRWCRSTVPVIGNYDSHAAFVVPRSNYAIFIGTEQVTDVAGPNIKWFALGASLPAGEYFWLYCGGAYSVYANAEFSILQNRVKFLYNDGIDGHDGVTSFAEVFSQYFTNNIMEPVALFNNHDERVIRIQGKLNCSGQFIHEGGKIGMKFEDANGPGFWASPRSLPFWAQQDYIGGMDSAYVNNSLLGTPVTYGLWAILFTALDDITFVRTFRNGAAGGQVTVTFYFNNATPTRANLRFTTMPTGGVVPVSPPRDVTFAPGLNQVQVTWAPAEKTDVGMTFKVEADSAFASPPFNRPPPTKFININMTPVIPLPAGPISGDSVPYAGSVRRVTAYMHLANTGWGPTFNLTLTITFTPNTVIFTPPPPTTFIGGVFQGVGNLNSSRLVSFLAFETRQVHGSAVVHMKLSDGTVVYDEGDRTIIW